MDVKKQENKNKERREDGAPPCSLSQGASRRRVLLKVTVKSPRRVAVYIRTGQPQDEEVLKNSSQALVQKCRDEGWSVSDIYIDNGYSGLELNRPQLKKMLEDAKSKKFDTILVEELSRLTRNLTHLLKDVTPILIENGISLFELHRKEEIPLHEMVEKGETLAFKILKSFGKELQIVFAKETDDNIRTI